MAAASSSMEALTHSGNRCGHNPSHPNWYVPPKVHKHRMDVICWAQENVKQYYNNSHKWLASLRKSRKSKRRQRSEGRERDGKLLQVLLQHCELASLRVGTPQNDGSFINLSMKDIALRLGWRTLEDDKEDKDRLAAGKQPRYRGIKRVWRGLQDLKAAECLQVYECVESIGVNEIGQEQYRGLPAVKCLTMKLFKELGISLHKLNFRRKQAANRLKRKYQSYLQEVNAGLTNLTEKLKPACAKKKAYNPDRARYYREQRIELKKQQVMNDFWRRNPELYELHQQHPHLSITDCEKLLKQSKQNQDTS